MKKKILLMISMCFIMLGMTACGEADPTTVDYNGYTYDQLKSTCENTATTLKDMPDEQKAVYLEMADMSDSEKTSYITSLLPSATEKDIEGIVQQANLISRWEEATKDIGGYVELGEFTITKSGKTLTCDLEIVYEERPLILTYVYTYRNMQVEDINVDQVQTLGEKMTNAALNTLMGMGIVFIVLILICLIIYCFKFLSVAENKKKKAEPAPVAKATPAAPAAPVVQAQDDLELVAVIAAAIAASTGTSTDDFVVRSIKRRF